MNFNFTLPITSKMVPTKQTMTLEVHHLNENTWSWGLNYNYLKQQEHKFLPSYFASHMVIDIQRNNPNPSMDYWRSYSRVRWDPNYIKSHKIAASNVVCQTSHRLELDIQLPDSFSSTTTMAFCKTVGLTQIHAAIWATITYASWYHEYHSMTVYEEIESLSISIVHYDCQSQSKTSTPLSAC